MPRQRLIVATLLFLGAFAIIAQLAWNTAIATSGPWFSPAISRDVYSTTMIAATVLVAVLAALASGQSASAAREARALDLRFNILRGSGAMASGAEGFAASHYVTNTALILFLGYGWPFLVGWVAVGLGFARAQEGKHALESK